MDRVSLIRQKWITARQLLRDFGVVEFMRELFERVFVKFTPVRQWIGKNDLLMENTKPNSPIAVFDVSVVVPTFNGSTDLETLIQSLFDQKNCNIEVILVDSGSDDGSVERLVATFGVIVVPISRSQFTHSFARNIGVQQAKNSLVFLTVQDARLPQGYWLYDLCTIMESHRLGALSSSESPRPDVDWYGEFSQESYQAGLGQADSVTRIDSQLPFARKEKIQAASIGNVGCLYRRDLLLKKPFLGTFAEDLIWALSALRDNIPVGKTSELRIIHSHNRSAFYWFSRMYQSQISAIRNRLTSPFKNGRYEDWKNLVSSALLIFCSIAKSDHPYQETVRFCRSGNLNVAVVKEPLLLVSSFDAEFAGVLKQLLNGFTYENTVSPVVIVNALKEFVEAQCTQKRFQAGTVSVDFLPAALKVLAARLGHSLALAVSQDDVTQKKVSTLLHKV